LYFDTSDLIQKYIDTQNGATEIIVLYYNPKTKANETLISTTLPTDQLLWSRMGFNWDVNGENYSNTWWIWYFYWKTSILRLGNQVSGADDGFFQIWIKTLKWPQVEIKFGLDPV
jgi:hypothetical protein